METRANYIAVGAFMLAVLAAGFVFVYWLAVTGDGVNHKRVTLNFKGSVTGLVKGGQVLFNGIKVGEVVELKLDQRNPTKVQAVVTVDARTPLKSDTTAELGYQGLTGVAYVHLKGGTIEAEDILKLPNPSINASRSGMEDLIEGAQNLMGRADNAINSIQKMIDDISPGVKKTVENVESFSAALAANSEGIESFLADVSGAAKSFTSLATRLEALTNKADIIVSAVDPNTVRAVVDDVKAITGELAKASSGVDAVIGDAREAAQELKTFAQNINKSLAQIDQVIASVDPAKISKTVENVESLSARLAARGEDIEKFIKSASSAAGNIDLISQGIAARSGDIDAIISNVRSAAVKFDSALFSADKILSAIDAEKVAKAVSSIESVTSRIAAKGEEIDTFLSKASSAAVNVDLVSAAIAERTDDIKAIIGDVRSAAAKMQSTLDSADKLISAIPAKSVAETVENIRSVTGRLAERGDDIEAIIVDARAAMGSVRTVTGDIEKRREDVLQIITDARELAARLNASSVRVESILLKVDNMLGELGDSDTKGLITEATLAARAIRKVVGSFESRSDVIAAGIARFSSRGLREVESMVKEWRRTAKGVQRAVSKFERNPQGILFGSSGPRSYRRR